jgi:DNA topoisomerase I
VSTPDTSFKAAEAVGLVYVSDEQPGIRRRRRGKSFSYHRSNGEVVRDEEVRSRIRSLAIPPAWTEVWICEDPLGHIQATGRDARGRKQYRYHPRWGEHRSADKYARTIAFSDALPAIRARVEHDLQLDGLPREKVLATIVRLLETTFIRIGNAEYAKRNRSYGLTTLRDGHVTIEGSRVRFKFAGKSGQEHDICLKDRRLARIIQRARDVPGQELFQYVDDQGVPRDVDSGDVNDYLRSIVGQDFSAKDYRTWGGTLLALRELRKLERPPTERATRKAITDVICSVSNVLGNRPATCRKYYVHPTVLDAFANGTLWDAVSEVTEKRIENAPHELDLEEAALRALLNNARESLEADVGEPVEEIVAAGHKARRLNRKFRRVAERGEQA